MAIIRIHTGSDGKSHFEEIVPKLEPRGDKSESAELIPGSGIVIRRFEPTRSNPWHHAPGRYAVLPSPSLAPSQLPRFKALKLSRFRRARADPFPVSGRRESSAQMEPSRRGAAHACRVVRPTPPTPRRPNAAGSCAK